MLTDRPIHESHEMTSRLRGLHCACYHCEAVAVPAPGKDRLANAHWERLTEPCPANKLYQLEQRVETLEKWRRMHLEAHKRNLLL